MKEIKNGHICLDCSLTLNYVLKTPVKIHKCKCTLCKKSKDGASKKHYINEVNDIYKRTS